MRSPTPPPAWRLVTEKVKKETVAPCLLAVLIPLVVGVVSPAALAGLLLGALGSGFVLSTALGNAGGAWKGARKYIEGGGQGGRGSPSHLAAAAGDMVGHYLRDASSPALNSLLTVMSAIASGLCAAVRVSPRGLERGAEAELVSPRIKQASVDAVAASADIVDVISGYTSLRKRGLQLHGALSFPPGEDAVLLGERRPGLYYCFGCGEGGNVFTLPSAHGEPVLPGSGRGARRALRRAARVRGRCVHRTPAGGTGATPGGAAGEGGRLLSALPLGE